MKIDHDLVFTMEVIICTKKRRGNGTDDPIRVVTEVFSKDGELIAEYDELLVHNDSRYGIKPKMVNTGKM